MDAIQQQSMAKANRAAYQLRLQQAEQAFTLGFMGKQREQAFTLLSVAVDGAFSSAKNEARFGRHGQKCEPRFGMEPGWSQLRRAVDILAPDFGSR